MSKKLPDMSFQEFHLNYATVFQETLNDLNIFDLECVLSALQVAIKKNATIFICGNGGSSAIASHFVCDYVKGARTGSEKFPKMYCLNDNLPLTTAISNDIGYKEVFSYQLQSLASKNDILFVVSSSGNSPNILRALEVANNMKLVTVAFTGFDGGSAKDLAKHCVHIKSDNYGIIEDIHHLMMHSLTQYLTQIGGKSN
jgi:phosphoheptose isomerase